MDTEEDLLAKDLLAKIQEHAIQLARAGERLALFQKEKVQEKDTSKWVHIITYYDSIVACYDDKRLAQEAFNFLSSAHPEQYEMASFKMNETTLEMLERAEDYD